MITSSRFDEHLPADAAGTVWMCQLGEMNKNCSCRDEDGVHCNGHTVCCFCEEVKTVCTEAPQKQYVRKARWYEKYYRDGGGNFI